MHTRRSFFSRFGLLVLALVTFPAAMVRAKSVALPLARAKNLKKVGGSAVLKIKGRTLLFVRDSEETVRAFDAVCTHAQCVVEYNKRRQRIECPCHGSTFDMAGEVLQGPAEGALTRIEARLAGEKIVFDADKPFAPADPQSEEVKGKEQ